MNNLLLSVQSFSDNLVSILGNSLGIWYLIILNAFGVIAIGCKVCEYQSKKRSFAFMLANLSQMLWTAYFIFSGDFVSAISCVITFSAVMLFKQRDRHKWAKSVWWLVLFLAIQGTLSFFTYKSWKDIFVILAGVTGVMAYFCVDMRKYRILSFFYASFWLLNSIMKIYLLALISDLASVVSVSIGIFRYDILKSKSKEKEIENSKQSTSA